MAPVTKVRMNSHLPAACPARAPRVRYTHTLRCRRTAQAVSFLNTERLVERAVLAYGLMFVAVLTLSPMNFAWPPVWRIAWWSDWRDVPVNMLFFVPMGYLFLLARAGQGRSGAGGRPVGHWSACPWRPVDCSSRRASLHSPTWRATVSSRESLQSLSCRSISRAGLPNASMSKGISRNRRGAGGRRGVGDPI